MTSYAQAYPGNYLEAADIPPDGAVLEITGVDNSHPKADNGQVIDKPILSFKAAKKKLICNKTNMRRILALYAPPGAGADLEKNLIGVKIKLTTELVRNPKEGRNTPAVRVDVRGLK